MENLNMALFILYYILLIIFTKFNAFKKQRNKLGFRGTLFLIIFTTIIFIINCYSIYSNPTFIFGLNAENKILRITFLLFFITTFFTIFAFLLADYFRNESNNKYIIQGFKGIKGLRGPKGKNKKISSCDENVCSEKICNKKIMKIISDAYTEILKKKNVIQSHNGSQIENKFLINKVNLLCQSTQFLELNKEKKAEEIYGGVDPKDSNNIYEGIIKSTWKKWLEIILKYEKGIEFLENEDLVDNDFDNMITDKDKIYSKDFSPSITYGTPSKGLESPFDEIKKYDMWYWGEKKEAVINVQYFCDKEQYKQDPDNYNPVLYKLDSNQYNNIWRSKIAFQKVVGDEFTPFQNKGSKVVSIYRPKIIENEQGIFKPLGDVIFSGDITSENQKNKNNSDDNLPKNNFDINFKPNLDGDPKEPTILIAGDIKSPDNFKPIYKSKRSKGVGINKYGYSLWKPQIKNEENKLKYKCLGLVFDKGVTLTPPNKNLYSCVPEKCVRPILNENLEPNFWSSEQPNNLEDIDQIYPENNESIILTKNKKNKLFYVKEDKEIDTDESDDDTFYELIPSGETYQTSNGVKRTSCFDNELANTFSDSKWVVPPKNDDTYSIHSHFNKSSWKK